jgi:hypothetical protein
MALSDTGWKPARSPAGARDFLLQSVQTASETHPASHAMDTRSLFPRSKADHFFPSSDDVKNEWIYTPTPPYFYMVCACSLSTQYL